MPREKTAKASQNPSHVEVRQLQELNEIFTRVIGQIFLTPASSSPENSVYENLGWPQKKLLFLVEAKGPQKMSEIARALSLTMSGATAMIDKLVRMELVTRISDPTDRRVIRIGLSDRGRSMGAQCMQVQERCFREILERLESRDRAELLDSFQTIHRLLTTIEGHGQTTQLPDSSGVQTQSGSPKKGSAKL